MSAGSAGGWNARVPPGASRCTCQQRRYLWAQLSPDAATGCCGRSCCQTRLSVIIATREEVFILRGRAVQEGWRCGRCGEYVARHWRGYECLDQSVKRLRAKKQASGVRYRP